MNTDDLVGSVSNGTANMRKRAHTDVESTRTGIDPIVYARRWKITGVLCASLMVVIIGNTSLNVALPTLARDLNASLAAQQWMVDAYALVFAGLLLTAGTIGDRFGRKGALQIGLVVVMSGALFAAFMNSAAAIIAGRAVMGLGAAFVMPATLSILTHVFPPGERAKAIGVWAGISGGGAAVGPVASGFLLKHFSWGSVFLINVPIIAVALVAGFILLPKSKDPEPDGLDPIGALLSIASLGSLVYAIIEAPHRGWLSPTSGAWFLVAVVLLGAFLAWEMSNPAPMLNLSYFRDPRFGVAAGIITLVFFAAFGFFFLWSQYFQLVVGYSAFEAGVRQLPFAVVAFVASPLVPRWAARIGVNRIVAAGLVSVASAMAVFALVGRHTSYAVLASALMVWSFGMSIILPSMTGSIMSAVPLGKAGVGSAMNDTTRELGGALGVAVLGSLVASRYASGLDPALPLLPDSLKSKAGSSLSGALEAARNIPDPAAAHVSVVAREAFLSGMHLAALVSGCVALLAAAIVYRRLPAANPHTGRLASRDEAAAANADLDIA